MDIISKCESYGLSTAAAIDIKEAVEAYQDYDKLPQASLDSMQIICDMFNVSLSFNCLKRNKMALTGIWNELRSSYLYTEETLKDRELKKHWPKNSISYDLRPNSNNLLVRS